MASFRSPVETEGVSVEVGKNPTYVGILTPAQVGKGWMMTNSVGAPGQLGKIVVVYVVGRRSGWRVTPQC